MCEFIKKSRVFFKVIWGWEAWSAAPSLEYATRCPTLHICSASVATAAATEIKSSNQFKTQQKPRGEIRKILNRQGEPVLMQSSLQLVGAQTPDPRHQTLDPLPRSGLPPGSVSLRNMAPCGRRCSCVDNSNKKNQSWGKNNNELANTNSNWQQKLEYICAPDDPCPRRVPNVTTKDLNAHRWRKDIRMVLNEKVSHRKYKGRCLAEIESGIVRPSVPHFGLKVLTA